MFHSFIVQSNELLISSSLFNDFKELILLLLVYFKFFIIFLLVRFHILISGSFDCLIKVWNVSTGELIQTFFSFWSEIIIFLLY